MKKLLLVLLVVLGFISCGDNSKKTNESVLNISFDSEGKSIDPQLATDIPSFTILNLVEEGLGTMNDKLNFVPGLAQSWDISEDGKVWTFHLRDGLKWSNGEALTANDFKFAWLRALNPETASEYAYALFPIKNAKEYNSGKVTADEVGIKVIDDKTLEVTLDSPTPYFDSLTAFGTSYPLNEKFYNEHKDNYALEPENMLYCGPYVISKWNHNADIVLEKNPYYYDADKVKIDRINIKFIGDLSSSLNAFKNDEIDFVRLSAEQFQEYQNDPRVTKQVQNSVNYLGFNMRDKIMSNVNIRRAIYMAIDRENMANVVLNGVAKVSNSFTPEGVGMKGENGGDFIGEVGGKAPKYNVEEAKRLLNEGLKQLGLKELPPIELLVSSSGSSKKVAEYIQEDLRKNLGITVNVEGREFKERIAKMKAGEFQMVYSNWTADYLDPMTYLDIFESTSGTNRIKYNNPEYDKLVELARKETDTKKRIEYMRQMEDIIATDIPMGPLTNNIRITIVNPKVKGVVFTSFGPEFLLKNAYIEKQN